MKTLLSAVAVTVLFSPFTTLAVSAKTVSSNLSPPSEATMEKNERRARQKLAGISQDHIFKYWSELDELRQEQLIEQIDHLDLTAFRWQQEVLNNRQDSSSPALEPFTDYAYAGEADDIALGRQLIAEGKVACLIVAGGQGSRLQMEGPKGKYPITPIKNKTLFQLFAEKTLAAGKQAGKMLRLAIMTSPQNHEETVRFFADNDNFGLSSLQLSFFTQGALPLLDLEGNLFLDERDHIAAGPDGNGSCLKALVESGIWERWKKSGIEYVNFVLVDNPLADPYDANLIGRHAASNNCVTVKCVERDDPKEKVGVIVNKDGHAGVVEYTEFPESEKAARLADGALKHRCANISLFCFGIDFVQEAASCTTEMPLHLAFKAVKALDEAGHPIVPAGPNAWKYERFIFDVLPMAAQVGALIYPRERCFAPLKNYEGSDSPATVRAQLQRYDRIVLEELTGQPSPSHPFELSQEFHYPTDAFRAKWSGRKPPLADYYD